ncbi:MAG: hypothetical protein DMG45_01055 [Acidobacteria bacterium]|nr:MAG: hypothetical protein DMG45_01055 [Acidobacteriota bacterium]
MTVRLWEASCAHRVGLQENIRVAVIKAAAMRPLSVMGKDLLAGRVNNANDWMSSWREDGNRTN